MTPEILQKLLGQGPKEPDIPVSYDPDEIRVDTHGVGEWIEKGRRTAIRIVLPILYGFGLTGLAFDYAWLSHFAATVLLVGLLANMGINAISLARLRSLEAAGKFDDIAEIVFTAKSGYWFHRELEENPASGALSIALAVVLIGGSFLVTWYFVMSVAVLSILSDAYMAHFVNSKGKGLVEYKRRWDELQATKRAEAELARRKHDETVREILGDEEEPNALDKDGAFYDPDPVAEVRDANDHSDIKYEDDDGTIREG